MESYPLAVSITEASRISGVGRTSLYAAISKGSLRVKKLGARTLVETAALRQFIEDLPDGGPDVQVDTNDGDLS